MRAGTRIPGFSVAGISHTQSPAGLTFMARSYQETPPPPPASPHPPGGGGPALESSHAALARRARPRTAQLPVSSIQVRPARDHLDVDDELGAPAAVRLRHREPVEGDGLRIGPERGPLAIDDAAAHLRGQVDRPPPAHPHPR